jgi:hypothetical protein
VPCRNIGGRRAKTHVTVHGDRRGGSPSRQSAVFRPDENHTRIGDERAVIGDPWGGRRRSGPIPATSA